MSKIARLLPVLGGKKKTYAQKVLALSPIAYWPLTEASGTAAIELVSGYNGTYTGAGIVLAQAKAPFVAPYFDGSTAYVDLVTSGLQTTFPFPVGTVVAWVWIDFDIPNAGDANDYNPFYIRQFSSEIRQLSFDPNGGSGAGRTWGITTANSTAKTAYLAGGVDKTGWHLMGHSWNCAGGSYRLNFDKTFNNDQTGVLTPLENAVLVFGIGRGNAATYFKGWIGHVQVYNKVLLQADYDNLYAWAGI